jgi:hypothetical protein
VRYLNRTYRLLPTLGFDALDASLVMAVPGLDRDAAPQEFCRSGHLINSYRYKSRHFLAEKRNLVQVCLMSNPALPHASTARACLGNSTDGKEREEKFVHEISCNPLISLDSDERIQGNPRQSNTLESRFSQRNSTGQENPNGSTAKVAGPAGRRAAPSPAGRRWPAIARLSGRAMSRPDEGRGRHSANYHLGLEESASIQMQQALSSDWPGSIAPPAQFRCGRISQANPSGFAWICLARLGGSRSSDSTGSGSPTATPR